MTLHNRRLKEITFELGTIEFQCQLQAWKIVNNSDDGDRLYSFCPDGEDVEEVDPDYSLELTFYSDWKEDGISDFLTTNDGTNVAFTLDHLEGVVGEHVRWVGNVRVKAPDVGGEVRSTEMTEITMQCIGKPVYSRPVDA